jgi:hypothetical protein
MHLLPGGHPAIIQENIKTLKGTGMDEHQAIHHAHAHAKATGSMDGPPASAGDPQASSPVADNDADDPPGDPPAKSKGPMINPAHKGRLHAALHVPEGEPIPAGKLAEAEHSKNPHMRQMANFAENAKGFAHPKK